MAAREAEHQESAARTWLTTAAFAATAGISERAARKALARAFEGRRWRGKVLIVRSVVKRGKLTPYWG